MANPLPNEKELYERIKSEKITISLDIWDLLYYRIGNDISAINLLCQYYLNNQQPIPIQEAKRILFSTRHIKEIVNQITCTSSKEDFPFPEFLDDIPIHPIVGDMFMHYIGNDIHAINLIVQDTIDPIDPKPVSLEIIKKILNHTHSIREFMERLRIATSQEARPPKPQEPAKGIPPKQVTKDELFFKIRKCLAQEFKLSEEKIQLNSRFREDLGFDSIDGLRVVMVLEEEFGLEIPDDVPDKIFTVAEAVEYTFKKLSHP